MLLKGELFEKSQCDIQGCGNQVLFDICSCNTADPKDSIEKRFGQYITNTNNPYLFHCGATKVKISFAGSGSKTLDRALVHYFRENAE